MHICANTHSKNIFFSDVHENSHMDVHYMADEDFYVKNGFSKPEGAATCHLFGFQLVFSTFFTITIINGQHNDLITTKPIDQMYTL